jgi:hypothetical protein
MYDNAKPMGLNQAAGQISTPTVARHLNNLHRRLGEHAEDIRDLSRRIEQIERFIGVNFSTPRDPCDVVPLDFSAPTE